MAPQFDPRPRYVLSSSVRGEHQVFDELGGMMISRRPNNRASRDQTPGPRQMRAIAMTAASAAASGAARNPSFTLENQERPVPAATTAAPSATYRVKRPIKSRKPTMPTAATASHPKTPSSRLSPV